MKNYSILIENDLITLAQKQHDHLAIEELLCRYKNTVRAIARRFYTTNGDIEDLVQEGMITLYHAILSYDNRKYRHICIALSFAKQRFALTHRIAIYGEPK